MVNRENPYNPYGAGVEFDINRIAEGDMVILTKEVRNHYGVNLNGNMLVMEGCPGDDITLLGGEREFYSHFCTLFNFGVCNAM